MFNFYIPHDLVYDILSRLPVKYLLQFKCVSKSWCSIIDSPEFIKVHTKRSKKTESNKKFIAGGLHDGLMKTFKLSISESNFSESSKQIAVEEISYPSLMYDMKYGIQFAGSCNGLLCLVYSNRDLTTVLWNPSTREYRVLPICSKQYRTLNDFDYCLHGFGYDEVTDNYKVVRLIKYYNQHNQSTSSECFIYSLSSNEWRSFEGFSTYDLKWFINGVFTNGALHWLLKDNSVLAFNLVTEEFELIPPPEGLTEFRFVFALVHDGCLILLRYTWKFEPNEIWVMKDYGNKNSWTKLTLNVPLIRLLRLLPMQISNTDKYICLKAKQESSINYYTYNFEQESSIKYLLYNFEEQSFKEVKFPAKLESVKACFYFETLVKLNGTVDMNGQAKQQKRKRKRYKIN